jgi:hypothetical protein
MKTHAFFKWNALFAGVALLSAGGFVRAGTTGAATGSAGTGAPFASANPTPPIGWANTSVSNNFANQNNNSSSNRFGQPVPPLGTTPQNANAKTPLATNQFSHTNFFNPRGTSGYYDLGTNRGYLRGTNGFYRRGLNGRPDEFIPDGGELYERGADGVYRRYNTDDTRGIYRNGILYSAPNGMAGTNGMPATNGIR